MWVGLRGVGLLIVCARVACGGMVCEGRTPAELNSEDAGENGACSQQTSPTREISSCLQWNWRRSWSSYS